jgi:hypothetical protein
MIEFYKGAMQPWILVIAVLDAWLRVDILSPGPLATLCTRCCDALPGSLVTLEPLPRRLVLGQVKVGTCPGSLATFVVFPSAFRVCSFSVSKGLATLSLNLTQCNHCIRCRLTSNGLTPLRKTCGTAEVFHHLSESSVAPHQPML